MGLMTWPAWELGIGAPRASPPGVLECEGGEVPGSHYGVSWETRRLGSFWGGESSRGVVSTHFPSCWLPAINEKGKANHPKK